MAMFFSLKKKSHRDLDLGPRELKLVQDIVMLVKSKSVKNEGASQRVVIMLSFFLLKIGTFGFILSH